jgi:hypothetical protein
MVTAIFGPLAAAIAAALAQLPGRFWPARVATGPHSNRAATEAEPAETLGAAATDSSQTTGFIFYTLDDAFLPYGSDVLHWWFREPAPREMQAEIREGDLV